MKKLLVIVSLCFLSINGFAQETRFFDSLEDAKKISVTKEIPLLIYFSGSDWCKPCIQMKKEVFLSSDFATFSQEIAIYIADFPYRKKQSKELKKENEALADKYNPKGIFPNLVLVNSAGEILYQTTYKKQSPSELIAELKKNN